MCAVKDNSYDIIIVGAGPIGMTVAIEAKKAGLSHLIIEKGSLVNTIFNFPTNMTFFSTSKLLEIGNIPFISHSEKPNRSEALEYFRRVHEKWDLNINLYEQVNSVDKSDNSFVVVTSKSHYHGKNIVLATGFYDYPNLMKIPGEELSKVRHYYTEPHPYINQKVAVVGGANSACDVAMELYHKGADVTMIVRSDELSRRVKYWIKPNIENRIKEGSIKVYFKSKLKEIKEDEILIETPNGDIHLTNDFVLAMTGYKPDFDFLDKLSIGTSLDEGRIPTYNSETHESNIAGIYLAGVLCGGMRTNKFFIENAMDHASKIVKNIVSKNYQNKS